MAARRAVRTAQLMAAAALVVAMLAVVLSLAALANRRSDVPSAAPSSAAADASVAAPGSTAEQSERVEPSSRPTTTIDPGEVQPEADFQLLYERHAMRVQPLPGCDGSRYVDVDEPRVGVAEPSAEFGYGDACGGGKPTISLTSTDTSISWGDRSVSAGDCAEEIQNRPTNGGFVPTKGMSWCLVTSPTQAEEDGVSRKVVLVTVQDVAADNAIDLLVTAWSVPR